MDKSKLVTSSGKDITTSAFWEIQLDLATSADRTDVPLSLSGVEVVLDAFQEHQQKLFKELEWYRDDWAKEAGTTSEKLYPVKNIVHLMEQLNYLNRYINLIASELAADLREVGNLMMAKEAEQKPQAVPGEKANSPRE